MARPSQARPAGHKTAGATAITANNASKRTAVTNTEEQESGLRQSSISNDISDAFQKAKFARSFDEKYAALDELQKYVSVETTTEPRWLEKTRSCMHVLLSWRKCSRQAREQLSETLLPLLKSSTSLNPSRSPVQSLNLGLKAYVNAICN